MANIKTQFVLTDRMSDKLRKIHSATEKVNSSLDKTHKLSRAAGKSNGLGSVASQARKADSEINRMAQSTERSTQSAGRLKSAWSGVGRVITALAGAAFFKSGMDRLMKIDTAKAKLIALGHTQEGVTQIMDNAMDSVRGTAFKMEDAANTAASAVAAGVSPGKQLGRYLGLVADASAVAGASMGEMGQIFNKITTSGIVQAEELNQVADRGIPIFQMLADQMGVSAREVKQLASQGQVSSDMFLSAVENGFGGAAKVMGTSSFSAILANIGSAISRISAKFLDGAGTGQGFFSQIKPLAVQLLDTLKNLEDGAARVGEKIGAMFTVVVDKISGAVGFIRDNWSTISTILQIVITSFLAYKAVMGVVNAVEAVNVGLQNAKLLAMIKLLAIIALVIGAVYGLVALFNHFAGTSISALGIIMGAFYGLFAYIYNGIALTWNIIASFAEFLINIFIDPIYAIKMLWYSLVQAIGGYLVQILDVASQVVNFIGPLFFDLINKLIQGFHDWVGAVLNAAQTVASGVDGLVNGVIGGIETMVNAAIEGLNKLIGLANNIPGINIGTVGEVSLGRSNMAGAIAGISANRGPAKQLTWKNVDMGGKLQGILDNMEKPTSDKNVVSLPRMEYKSITGAFDKGYQMGEKIESGLGSLKNLGKDLDKMTDNPTDALAANPTDSMASLGGVPGGGSGGSSGGGGGNPTGGRLDSIGKIEKDINISDEDLKFLKDIAEARYVQNFVELTPTVSMKATISNDVDVDGLVRKIEEKLEEEFYREAEGVYV